MNSDFSRTPFEENAPDWWQGEGIYAEKTDGSFERISSLPDKNKARTRFRRTTEEIIAVKPDVKNVHTLRHWNDIESLTHKNTE